MCVHRIAAPEATCLAGAGGCSVWTMVPETMLEVAAPVALQLLADRVPVVAHPHPAIDRYLAAEIDGSVVAAVVVMILQVSTATAALWDSLRSGVLDDWLDGGLARRGVEGGRKNLLSFTDTGRWRELRRGCLLILANTVLKTRPNYIQRRTNLLFS